MHIYTHIHTCVGMYSSDIFTANVKENCCNYFGNAIIPASNFYTLYRVYLVCHKVFSTQKEASGTL